MGWQDMRASFGSLAVVVGILAAVAAVGIAAKGTSSASSSSAANVASVRHHFRFCAVCRESGLSPERLAETNRPNPCNLDGRPMMLASD